MVYLIILLKPIRIIEDDAPPDLLSNRRITLLISSDMKSTINTFPICLSPCCDAVMDTKFSF